MKIKEKTSQDRRDFIAIFECEHCGHECEKEGYDDANYHENVIPTFECDKCMKKADGNYKPLQTKYPEGFTV